MYIYIYIYIYIPIGPLLVPYWSLIGPGVAMFGTRGSGLASIRNPRFRREQEVQVVALGDLGGVLARHVFVLRNVFFPRPLF